MDASRREALLDGPRRFNDLLDQIPGIAANILSERLKRLERDALLVARPYSERPPRAAYELTAEGKELAGALRLLAHWGARHAHPAEAPRHPACGTLLEVRWYARPATTSSTTSQSLRCASCSRAAPIAPASCLQAGWMPHANRAEVADADRGDPQS